MPVLRRIAACALVFASLVSQAQTQAPTTGPVDRSTFSQPDRVRTTALDLDLSVSFEKHELAGTATLRLEWLDPAARELVLDTDKLTISEVEARDASGQFKPVKSFSLGAVDAKLGSALTITLGQQSNEVRIRYTTSPQASGLQWLDALQTAGKKQPFMFSQSQSIAGRSWAPLQDTPSVRFTYTAHIRTPKALRAVMSADNSAKHPLDGDYRFNMPQRIPSYLLALAVGDIAVKETGPRSAVYAEPQTVAAAAAEFSDVETMIKTTEALYGPYAWGRYDVLVLPPSFPFGGMENPRLTFATPTIITGDKSLISVIAHELAHSWSGNLVTMSTWRDSWLNEGFTTYVQGRIVEAVYGQAHADEEVLIDTNALLKSFKTMAPERQVLVSEQSSVIYPKGSWFLRTLEMKFGRANFDAFLRSYFAHFAFQSISNEQFVDYLKSNLLAKFPGKISEAELNAWMFEPGIPADAPQPVSARFAELDQLRDQFLTGKIDAPGVHAGKWRSLEWQYFLDLMPPKLSASQLKALDEAYHLTGTQNATIAVRWYRLAIASGYEAAYPSMREHMLKIGRLILVVPLYRDLAQTPEGKKLAQEIYEQAKPGYHPMTRRSVERTLGL